MGLEAMTGTDSKKKNIETEAGLSLNGLELGDAKGENINLKNLAALSLLDHFLSIPQPSLLLSPELEDLAVRIHETCKTVEREIPINTIKFVLLQEVLDLSDLFTKDGCNPTDKEIHELQKFAGLFLVWKFDNREAIESYKSVELQGLQGIEKRERTREFNDRIALAFFNRYRTTGRIPEVSEALRFHGTVLTDTPLDPVTSRLMLSSDSEVVKPFFEKYQGDDGHLRELKLARTKDKNNNPLAEARILYKTYNSSELKNFDQAVLITLMDVALQNPAPEGGWMLTLNQLYRAYFQTKNGEKIHPSGIALLENSINRLRASGFAFLDLRDAVNKNRIEASISLYKTPLPFLDADLGLITDNNPINGKANHTPGLRVKTFSPLYDMSESTCRLRNIQPHMRVPGLSRTEEIEQQFMLMLGRLLMGATGRKANNVTIWLVDQFKTSIKARADKSQNTLEHEGLLRCTATRDEKRRASERVETILHHWKRIGACDHEIEYETYRGKPTKIIKKFRLFSFDKTVILRTETIQLPKRKEVD